ncbi:hypothetical protein BROUX41_001848 [Berkeleyomyces rouxiae]|uniref:uncharacterized protein n=1 Tax=Berkeleyomyces rouxiae TaxID=2035830 RepID=UPI003B7BD225
MCAKKTKPAPKPASAAPSAPAPNWPPFKPALPITELAPEPLPALPDKVVLLRSFFPRSLCRDYVSFLRSLPLATTPGRPKRGDAARVNDRFQVQDPEFARRLWEETGLREAVLQEGVRDLWDGEPIGLNPNIRIYRYTKGQFFDAHYDDWNPVSLRQGATTVAARTTWTLLLYLTSAADGCVGGETVFFPFDRPLKREEIAVAPETGMVLLHKHGDDCMLHEGQEVKDGEKWIIRSDICVPR